MNYFKDFLRGILLGISNTIPGISGGTIAVVLGIYQKLLDSISIKNIKSNYPFLLPLSLGIVTGVFALSKIIIPLRNSYPTILEFIFIGLILGSIPSLSKLAFQDKQSFQVHNLILCILSLCLMIALRTIGSGVTSAVHIKASDINLGYMALILVTCAISSIAMLIPGISGSLVLLILGTYTLVIEGISTFNLLILIPTALGVLMGIAVGVLAIRKALKYFPHAMYSCILGLVSGSIFTLYNGVTFNTQGYIAIGLCIITTLLTYISCNIKE